MSIPNFVNLVSGGMDSYMVYRLFANGAKNLFVSIGHAYEQKEIDALDALAAVDPWFGYTKVTGASIGKYELADSGIIPLRNAELILNAAQYGNVIFLGVLKDELNSDKSPEFMSAMQTVLDISWRPQYWTKEGQQFLVTSPIRSYSKAELIRMFLEKGNAPVECLLKTVSCYNPNHRHCGECPSCFKRWVALTLNDITDDFISDPMKWAESSGVIEKAQKGIYPEQRSKEILDAIRHNS